MDLLLPLGRILIPTAFFIKNVNTEHFKKSRKKSLRSNLWMYIESKFKTNEIIVASSQENFVKHPLAIICRQSVLVLESEFMKHIILTLCIFKARNIKTLMLHMLCLNTNMT